MKIAHYEWDSTTDLIAQGGFSEVFKAKDQNLDGRFVALKIYKESIFQNTSSKSTGQREYSLQEEFKLVARLSHTNVISYYGLDYIKHEDFMGRKSQYPVLIMEYASMGTLVDFQSKNSDKMMSLKLLKEIISGVGYLHSEGIIHRDLKPGNILISPNSKGQPIAKITDFGISRAILSEDTIEHSMTQGVGTPHYMAPEQIYKSKFGYRGEITERTDYWGIGILAYWMGKGELPFGNNQRDYEIIRDEIVNKEPDWTGLPSPFREIAKACLVKNANDRTVELDDLLTIIRGDTTNENNSERTVLDFSGKTRDFSSGRYEPYNTLVDPKRATPTQEHIVPTKRKKSLPIIFGVTVGIVLMVATYFFWRASTIDNYLSTAYRHYDNWEQKDAISWFTKAADMGSGEAMYMLSTIYYRGYGVEKNPKKGFEYANLALKEGFKSANSEVAWDYIEGKSMEKDTTKALNSFKEGLNHLEKLQKQEKNLADLALGRMYYYGYAVPIDTVKAMQYFKIAAERGDPVAMRNLGLHYFYGEGTEVNEEEALKWYRKSAKTGYPLGIHTLGLAFEYSDQGYRNIDSAIYYYKTASEKNEAFSQYNLGILYYYGTKVTQDFDEAVWWFRKASENGHINSQNFLGTMYYDGKGVTKNLPEAFKFFQMAANLNDGHAQNNLGMMYINGFGVAKNEIEAVEWYRKSAQNGNTRAQLTLAKLFINESGGLKKSDPEAIIWFEKAAKLNDPLSMNALAEAYAGGQITAKDDALAAKWFYQAAIRGQLNAMKRMIPINKDGIGKEIDQYESERWRTNSGKDGFTELSVRCNVENTDGTFEEKRITITIFEKSPKNRGILDEVEEVLYQDHRAKLNEETKRALLKLHKLAVDNKVGFIALTKYALDEANK